MNHPGPTGSWWPIPPTTLLDPWSVAATKKSGAKSCLKRSRGLKKWKNDWPSPTKNWPPPTNILDFWYFLQDGWGWDGRIGPKSFGHQVQSRKSCIVPFLTQNHQCFPKKTHWWISMTSIHSKSPVFLFFGCSRVSETGCRYPNPSNSICLSIIK